MGSNPIGHPTIPRRIPPPSKWPQPALKEGAGAGAAFAANVAAAVAQVRANLRGAARGDDPEYLHQVRVGLRRLRSTLRAFRGLIRRRSARRFERALRSTQRALGITRDWDEFTAAQTAPALQRAARRPHALARQSARRILAGARFKALAKDVLAWSAREPWRATSDPRAPLGGFAARALQRLYGSLCQKAEGIDWADAARRHRVRIRLKRLRYGCECFAPAYPANEAEPLLHRMRTMQHLLGELSDIRAQRRLLGELARDAGLEQAAERARQLLATRERRLIRGAGKAWSKFRTVPPYWRRGVVRDRG